MYEAVVSARYDEGCKWLKEIVQYPPWVPSRHLKSCDYADFPAIQRAVVLLNDTYERVSVYYQYRQFGTQSWLTEMYLMDNPRQKGKGKGRANGWGKGMGKGKSKGPSNLQGPPNYWV